MAVAERAITHKSDKFVDGDAEAGEVEAGWRHALALHETQVGLPMALQAAEQAWGADPSEATWARIVELQDRMARRSEAEGPSGTLILDLVQLNGQDGGRDPLQPPSGLGSSPDRRSWE